MDSTQVTLTKAINIPDCTRSFHEAALTPVVYSMMDLPIEMRYSIFERLLNDQKVCFVTAKNETRRSGQHDNDWVENGFKVFRVNQQMYEEALKIAHESVSFCFFVYDGQSSDEIITRDTVKDQWLLKKMRHVEIHVAASGMQSIKTRASVKRSISTLLESLDHGEHVETLKVILQLFRFPDGETDEVMSAFTTLKCGKTKFSVFGIGGGRSMALDWKDEKFVGINRAKTWTTMFEADGA